MEINPDECCSGDHNIAYENIDCSKDRRDRKLAYYRDYYRRKVDLNKERERKQLFYQENRQLILEKARARYQKKKLAKLGIQETQCVEVNDATQL
jgi:type III secretory pathway component EscR